MKKRILFINNGKSKFAKDFLDACNLNEIESVFVKSHANSILIATKEGCKLFHLNEEIDLSVFDYCFVRIRGKNPQMTSLICELLQQKNIPFNDLHSIEYNKATQMVKFSLNNLPIPKSIIFSKPSYLKNIRIIEKNIEFPCVLKGNGSKGNSVWKITNINELENKLEDLKDDIYILQEYIENDYDVRALFLNDTLIAGMERYSNDGFYNNVSKGASTKIANLSENEILLCKKAMTVSGLDFGGVDFIRRGDDVIFLEINRSPQVQGIENISGVTVPFVLINEIKKRYL